MFYIKSSVKVKDGAMRVRQNDFNDTTKLRPEMKIKLSLSVRLDIHKSF